MNTLLRETGKLALNALQSSCVALGRAAGIIDFPVPPNSSMRKTSSSGIRHYYVSGVNCALPIATMALHHGVRLGDRARILDFGCGAGRQLLHFSRQFPKAEYYACDVDPTLVAFVRENYPAVKAQSTNFQPPLPYHNGQMDMIYSVSTFSHFSPEAQLPWLKELFRITAPGGYCFLTTEGFTALDPLREYFGGQNMERALMEMGILFQEYDFLEEERIHRPLAEVLNRTTGITGRYGATLMTPDYIRRVWPDSGFRVVDVIEGIIDARQDLVVLRKPNR